MSKQIGYTGEVLRRTDEKSDHMTWFRASTDDIDRHGSIVNPRGINTDRYDQNPVFVWGHDAYGGNSAPAIENVLGRVMEYHKSDHAFDIAVRWASDAENPRATLAKNMVRGGILNAVSIGFIPNQEKTTTRSVDDVEIPVYNETELIEVSLVTVPSNPNAVALVRAMQTADTFPSDAPPAFAADTGADGVIADLANNLRLASFASRLRRK